MGRRNAVVRRVVLRMVGSTLIPLLAGCRSGEKERALAQIEDARRHLAALAPRVGEGLFARRSVSLARDALVDAESAVRREGPLDMLGDEPEWQPRLRRALDRAEIASWVVEREHIAERDEARAWLDSAEDALRSARRSRWIRAHYQVQNRIRSAEQALAEADRQFEQERFRLAAEKALEAMALAGELPPETRALLDRLGDPANRRRWSQWVRAAIEESNRDGKPALVVDKRAQLAVLWSRGRPTRWLNVELGYNGLNQKLRAGDGATPEGSYHVVRRKQASETRFYKALLLDYPNGEDRRRFARAKANGELGRSSSIGGLIEIHGEGGRGGNWTDGCIAVTNKEMDPLFEALKVGSAVVIVGSYEGMRVEGGGK